MVSFEIGVKNMKVLLSEAGQCIVSGIIMIAIIAGFAEMLRTVTGG